MTAAAPICAQRCPRCPPGIPVAAWPGQLDTWLQCDGCDLWFHASCLRIPEQECQRFEKWFCDQCRPTFGPITCNFDQIICAERSLDKVIRTSRSSKSTVDYAALGNPDMIPTSRNELIQSYSFAEESFLRIRGDEFEKWIEEFGFTEPVLFEKPDGLNMRMPSSTITVKEIAEIIGMETPVEVIEVATQTQLRGWTLASWSNYIKQSLPRDRILNVISLEISGTRLSEMITRPSVIRAIDWFELAWPEHRTRRGDFPKVQLYCLMGVEGAYTDFHIDLGGTSVFYHVLSGRKTFFFIPPTPTNLKIYERWCKSDNQSHVFLADLVEKCYRVDIFPNNTMIIPTGWIHAVLTPQDSIVIGGNFLHGYQIPLQVEILRIEDRTQVEQQYRFPMCEQMYWYIAEHYTKILQGPDGLFSEWESKGMKSLVDHLNTLGESGSFMPLVEAKSMLTLLLANLTTRLLIKAENMVNPTQVSPARLCEEEAHENAEKDEPTDQPTTDELGLTQVPKLKIRLVNSNTLQSPAGSGSNSQVIAPLPMIKIRLPSQIKSEFYQYPTLDEPPNSSNQAYDKEKEEILWNLTELDKDDDDYQEPSTVKRKKRTTVAPSSTKRAKSDTNTTESTSVKVSTATKGKRKGPSRLDKLKKEFRKWR